MLFYEIEFEAESILVPETRNEEISRNRRLMQASRYQNTRISKTIRFDIIEINGSNIILAIAVNDENKDDEIAKANEFIDKIGFKAKLLNKKELTIGSYIKDIEEAESNGFIRSERYVYSKVNENLSRYSMEDLREEIVPQLASREKAIEKARGLYSLSGLENEIGRIFQGSSSSAPFAHPVQYTIFSNDENVRKKARNILVSSLYSAGRLKSRRICFVGPENPTDECSSYDADKAEQLYEDQQYTTLIFTPPQISLCGDSRASNNEYIERICNCISKYHKNTLTIIELNMAGQEVFEDIKYYLPGIRFVELKENLIDARKAKKSLKSLAAEDGIKDIDSLLSLLEDGSTYYSEDLNRIYSNWLDDRLCEEVYPQYKDAAAKSGCHKVKAVGDAYNELLSLVGLGNAKKVIKSAIDYNIAQQLFKENGLQSERLCSHMVFTGNPGSAKTTVARLFASIMKDNKLLSTGRLIEVGRADIVDRFVGGTAPRVKRLFSKASGNVLFIDEAYSLCDRTSGMYGDEAINTIVQEMENHRDDTVVIFAGYPDKMEAFLNSNPGLRSRIAFHVNFDDYSEDELWQILSLFAAKNEMKLGCGVEEKVRPILKEASSHVDFGNGRFVRNLFENARRSLASRLVAMDKGSLDREILTTLQPEDFERIEKYSKDERRTLIGFNY